MSLSVDLRARLAGGHCRRPLPAVTAGDHAFKPTNRGRAVLGGPGEPALSSEHCVDSAKQAELKRELGPLMHLPATSTMMSRYGGEMIRAI